MLNFFNNYNSEDFIEELKKIEKNTRRSKNVVRSLRITPIKTKEFSSSSSGYIATLGRQIYPVNEIALSSLEERATIGGAALRKLRPGQYSKIINSCLKTIPSKSKSIIVLYDNEILAFLSDGYKILPVDEIFSLVDEELVARGGKFVVGSADAYSVEAQYTMPQSMVSHYSDVVPHGYTPTVSIQSSNIGLSGANIFPELSYRGLTIPVGSPLCLAHKGDASIDKFKDNVKQIYSLFNKSLNHLKNLKNITIEHPIESMISICKKNHIPKKYVAGAVEYFKDLIDDEDEITAYDVYMAITEVIFIAESEGKDSKKLLALKENVARCLYSNWEEFDLPIAV